MSEDNLESDGSTDRRSLLSSVATGLAGTMFLAGSAAAADSEETVEPQYCEKTVYQHKCVDWDCSCNDCTYDSGTIHERRCCEDPYGKIISCGSWYATDTCC